MRRFCCYTLLAIGFVIFQRSVAAQSTPPGQKTIARQEETVTPVDPYTNISLFDAMKNGLLEAHAQGSGDGRMNLTMTNRSNRKLRVILPPGLIASGVSGQFGGMGGGMGGGGMMGGGMGGMGGGMGGGGMMGGGMGGRSGGSTVMMPSMGLMQVGMMLMMLTGDLDSWDFSSMMMGMMGGMGMGGGMGGMMGGMGGGMGGMGGGMGGMGGGGMMGGGMGGMGGGMGGMMGGGMRSVPPSGLPFATIVPNQTRSLPTSLVGVAQSPDSLMSFPAKGEELALKDAASAGLDQRTLNALTRMSYMKSPQIVNQMVMWNMSSGLEWDQIARLMKGRATSADLSLAKDLAERLQKEDALKEFETGRLHWDVTTTAGADSLSEKLGDWFQNRQMVGLALQPGVPSNPNRSALAMRVHLFGDRKAIVEVKATEGLGKGWENHGKFSLEISEKPGESLEMYSARISDALASGILDRIVRVHVTDKTVDGRKVYQMKVENASPLVLSGVAVQSPAKGKGIATIMNLSIRPYQALSVPLDPKSVSRFGLSARGVKVLAADLTAL